MREKILAVIEKNSRINLKDLAILLGESEAAVAITKADRALAVEEISRLALRGMAGGR